MFFVRQCRHLPPSNLFFLPAISSRRLNESVPPPSRLLSSTALAVDSRLAMDPFGSPGEHQVNTEHDIKTLNSLIETTLDSADGYAEAAKDAKSQSLVSLFNTRSAERRKVASTLQGCVRSLGGEPEDEGTVLASAHRMFVNLRTSVTSKDNTAVVDEVERGEDHIKAKFEDAMKDAELSPQTMSVIAEAYTSVSSGHDQMRDLKHSLHRE
jgi:uncharacterized protein (TIGR02284 family)